MTQEVQPLTWQKRTNLEEHQQFFAKINEIIANLAPTVDEAEAAIAQATQAIASANAAIATANAASANADAASQQAQTAANTVAGYDGRLTAAEGDIDALQAADAQNVKINNINQYAVGLTGNQDKIGGIKTFISGILNVASGNPEIRYYDDANKTNLIAGVGVRFKTPTSTNASIKSYAPKIDPKDNNEIQRGGFLQLVSNQNGTMTLNVFATKADGSLASKVLASFDGTSWS